MNSFIKINLNQTVSKTELKEKRTDTTRWLIFAAIVIAFLGLIGFQSFLIIKTNKLSEDTIVFKNFLNKKIKAVEQEIRAEQTAVANVSENLKNKPATNTSFEERLSSPVCQKMPQQAPSKL